MIFFLQQKDSSIWTMGCAICINQYRWDYFHILTIIYKEFTVPGNLPDFKINVHLNVYSSEIWWQKNLWLTTTLHYYYLWQIEEHYIRAMCSSVILKTWWKFHIYILAFHFSLRQWQEFIFSLRKDALAKKIIIRTMLQIYASQ